MNKVTNPIIQKFRDEAHKRALYIINRLEENEKLVEASISAIEMEVNKGRINKDALKMSVGVLYNTVMWSFEIIKRMSTMYENFFDKLISLGAENESKADKKSDKDSVT
jgi:hypothetical protein